MAVFLELNRSEYDVLLDVLTHAMGDLREEIYKTDAAEYKAGLKQREAALTAVLQRLTALGVSAGAQPASAAP